MPKKYESEAMKLRHTENKHGLLSFILPIIKFLVFFKQVLLVAITKLYLVLCQFIH